MDEKLMWNVLGIEPTKDEDILKNRYRELLVSVNPEDDPEGFKRLRQAYEMACELAKRSDEQVEEAAPKDEIDLWLDRVNDVYWYASTRNDPELWKELFQDEICVALDTALEARERFVAYLMEHVYVSHEIWQIIDNEFHIIDDMESLQEQFPRDFLEYIQYQIENVNFFTYEDLDILALDESEVQIDNYIVSYLRCKSEMDRDMYDDKWQRLDDLHAYEVYHPYEDVERIRLYIVEERPEDALGLVNKLLDSYPDDVYVGYWSGRVYWAMGEFEKAYECWQHVVDVLPDHYTSRVGIAEYYIKIEENVKAKDLIMDLLEENGRDEHVLDLMRIVNIPLIDYYKEQAQLEDYKKNMIEACWCMFQNEMFPETLECLNALDIQEDDPENYDYVNMKGRCYLGQDDYENAVGYLLKWEIARDNLVDDGTEKYKKRRSREGFIKSAIGVAYQNLKQFDLAEKYLVEGIKLEPDDSVRHSFMDRLALLYYDNRMYEKAIDVCSDIIDEDYGYYPAYLRRQQAAFEKQDGQLVVDDYYNALRIYPAYYKPYLLAIKVFCIYRQYEDARKVIECAKENGVEHEMFDFYEIRIARSLAREDDEYRVALEQCHALQNLIEEKKQAKKEEKEKSEIDLLEEDLEKDGIERDEVNVHELAFEEVMILMDLDDHANALAIVNREIEGGNKDYRMRWVLADIYRMRKEYEKAIEEYEILLEEAPDNDDVIYNIGLCQRRLGRITQAIESMNRVLELEPKHPRAHYELMQVYSQRFDNYELKTAYETALREATAQLANNGSTYYYIERGLLYMDNFNFNEALADYEKALELEPQNIYAYNNIGYVYQAQGQFEKAIGYFEKSISFMGEEHSMLPYINMSKCYEAMQQWDKAINVLTHLMQETKPTATIFNRLIELYTIKQDTEKVCQICEQAKKLNMLSVSDYYNKISEAYFIANDFKKGKKILKEWKSQVPSGNNRDAIQKQFDYMEAMGVFYFYHRELKDAVKCLEGAWKHAKKYGLYCARVGTHLATALYMLKSYKEATAIAKETMNLMLRDNHIPADLKEKEPENPESLEYYLSYRPLAPLRLFQTAQLYIAMGDFDRAERLLEECHKVPRCRHCAFGICYDAWLIRANIEEFRGNIDKAVELYIKAQKINPSDLEPTLTLDALLKKKGDRK